MSRFKRAVQVGGMKIYETSIGGGKKLAPLASVLNMQQDLGVNNNILTKYMAGTYIKWYW